MGKSLGRKLARRGAAILRRVSDEIEQSDTRRFFKPHGLPLELDVNKAIGLAFRELARGMDGKRRKKRAKSGKGSQRGGRP